MINKHELEIFIKRILSNGTREKAKYSLEQLKNIVEIQSASESEENDIVIIELLEFIDTIIENITEFQETAKESKDNNMPLTEEDMKIVKRRVADRKRREAEMAARGRC